MSITAVPVPQRTQSCCERSQQRAANSCVGRAYKRIEPYFPVINEGGKAIASSVNARAFQTIINFFINTTSATGTSWENYQGLRETMKVARLGIIVSIPFAIYGVVDETKDLFTKSHKTDSALRLAENLSWLASSSASFIEGLHMVGKVSEEVAKTVFHFYAASGILSVAITALHLKRRSEVREFSKQLATFQFPHQAFTHLRGLDDYKLFNLFDTDAVKLKGRLAAVQVNNQYKAMDEIKRHLSNRETAHDMAIVAALITLAASIILLYHPQSLTGYGMIAGASMIQIYRFFYNRRSVVHLDKRLAALA